MLRPTLHEHVVTSPSQLIRLAQALAALEPPDPHSPSLRDARALTVSIIAQTWVGVAPASFERAVNMVGRCLGRLTSLEVHGAVSGFALVEFWDASSYLGLERLVVGPSLSGNLKSESNVYPFMWRCRRLRHLRILPGVPAVLTNGLGDLVPPPLLTRLEISQLGSDEVFGLRNLFDALASPQTQSSLRTLHLDRYPCHRPHYLAEILSTTTSLTDLRLGPCGSEKTDDEVVWEAVGTLSHLERLAARPRNLAAFVAHSAKLDNLRFLSFGLGNDNSWTSSGISELADDAAGERATSSSSLRHLSSARIDGGFAALELVTVWGVVGLDDGVTEEVQRLEGLGVQVEVEKEPLWAAAVQL